MLDVCVIGHKPNKLPGGYNIYNNYNKNLVHKFRNILLNQLKENRKINCISGMSLGVDQLFVIACIGLKDEGYNINITAYLPCLEQDKLWSKEDKELYRDLLSFCDDIIYCSDNYYTKGCLQKRNINMINDSDLVIAVFDGSEGLTKTCINYAYDNNKLVLEIDPKDLL